MRVRVRVFSNWPRRHLIFKQNLSLYHCIIFFIFFISRKKICIITTKQRQMYIAQFSQLFTVTYRYITLNHGKLIFAYLYFCFLKTSTYENAVTFCERSANRLDTGADVTRLISSEMLLKCLCTQFVGKIRVYKACCNFSLTLRIYSFVLKSLQGTMALHSFVSVGIIGMMVST